MTIIKAENDLNHKYKIIFSLNLKSIYQKKRGAEQNLRLFEYHFFYSWFKNSKDE